MIPRFGGLLAGLGLAALVGACTEEAPRPVRPVDAAVADATPVDAAAIKITMGEPLIEIELPDGGLEITEAPAPKKPRKGPRRPARVKPKPGGSAPPSVARAAAATPMNTIRANMRDIQDCYGRVALKDPSIQGRIVVQWTIGKSGMPTATAIVVDELSDKSVGRCIKERAHRWAFPPPGGGVQVIKFPFNLKVQ